MQSIAVEEEEDWWNDGGWEMASASTAVPTTSTRVTTVFTLLAAVPYCLTQGTGYVHVATAVGVR